MISSRFLFSFFPLIILLCFAFGCAKQPAEKPAAENEVRSGQRLDEIPQTVLDSLRAKFPKAEIDKWTREKEGDLVIYDFEFKQEGWKFEADIKEDGSIHNWEKAVGTEELPEVVKKAVETRYPGSTVKEVMEITAVVEGRDALEGYEIVLKTAGGTEVEITTAPDGRILEDSGEECPTTLSEDLANRRFIPLNNKRMDLGLDNGAVQADDHLPEG